MDQMTQWQYDVVTYDLEGTKAGQMKMDLQQRGANGWEVISVSPTAMGYTAGRTTALIAVLKRPIPQPRREYRPASEYPAHSTPVDPDVFGREMSLPRR